MRNRLFLVALAGVVLLGAFLRFYKLDRQSFIADEYLGINIAYGYHQTGHWLFWDFNDEKITDEPYTRANIYHWQVAQIFHFLPVSEFSGRLVSVIWGIFGILLVYYLSWKFFKDKRISLGAAFLLALSISALMFDRKLRMYSMFAPLYLSLSYLFYQFLESTPQRGIAFINRISQKFQLNFNYIIPIIILGFVAFNTHLLTVNIFPSLAVYIWCLAVINFRKGTHNKKYLFLTALSIFGLVGLLLFQSFRDSIDFSVFNWSYIAKVTLDYSDELLALVIFIIGSYTLIKNDLKKGLWLISFFVTPLVLAIFIWDRNAGHQYIYFTEPFKVIIMSAGIVGIVTFISQQILFFKKGTNFALGFLLIFLLLLNIDFFFSKESFYKDPKKWSYPNYRQVYQYYLKKRQPNDLLITRKLFYYYLRGSHSQTLLYNEDKRLTEQDIINAQKDHSRIWFIASKDSYLDGSASRYIEKNFKSIKQKYAGDTINIWLWIKEPEKANN